MKSQWSYEAPTIEDVIPFVHSRCNQKSFTELYRDYIRYLTISEDTDTFIRNVMEWEDNYIGTI